MSAWRGSSEEDGTPLTRSLNPPGAVQKNSGESRKGTRAELYRKNPTLHAQQHVSPCVRCELRSECSVMKARVLWR